MSLPGKWVPQHHREITLARLEGFCTPERWHSDVNIRSCLTRCRNPVDLSVWSAPDLERPKFDAAVQQEFKPCQIGDSFGPSWSTHWFRVQIHVPANWSGSDVASLPLLLAWDSGSEAMLWSSDGQPLQGFTDARNEYRLSEGVHPGTMMMFYVEMACNGVGGCSDTLLPPPIDRRYALKVAEILVPEVAARQLLVDFLVLYDMAKSLPSESAAGARALHTANAMINVFRPDDPTTWPAARKLAAEVLQTRGATSLHKVVAVGHCHIDTAWLWPFEETHRKIARSWVSQLALMDQYPAHRFAASSAQQYAWLKADYPQIWSSLCEAVKAGRFLPVGGAWVEMDTNLPSGESLVRQLLLGQRFFQQNFGSRCNVFWLPDTFGYTAQLPQLIKGAGMDYFLTQKLSWNNINTFPHNTFHWEALDGTSVLTHFPPSNTYNSQVTVSDLMASVTTNKDQDRAPCSLLLFGNGDGGGGPTQAMCEALTRYSDSAGIGIDGLVRVEQGTPSQFFKELSSQSRDLLTWRGELYFELHRGTYTTHAANKAHNRACELSIREVEALGALATVIGAPNYSYPKSQVDELWQSLLLFQFHDVLPGSSIQMVYDHTSKEYPAMLKRMQQLRSNALGAIVRAAPQPQPSQPELHVVHDLQRMSVGQSVQNASHVQTSGQERHGMNRMAQETSVYKFEQGVGSARHRFGMVSDNHVPHIVVQDIAGARTYDNATSQHRDAVDANQPTTPQTRIWQQQHQPPFSIGQSTAEPLPKDASQGPWLFNSLSCARHEVVELPAALVPAGAYVPQTSVAGANPGSALLPVSLPPLSFTPAFNAEFGHYSRCLTADPQQGATACCLTAGNGETVYQLMNTYVKAVFNKQGRLVSLLDRTSLRELVAKGHTNNPPQGNRIRIMDDQPIFWDAWDIEVYHLETARDAGVPTALQILETGPVRATLQYTAPLTPHSTITQSISLTAMSPRIDFVTTVDWHENRKCLKVEFPWDLRADTATYEVQFGAVTRPTHQNTSWDWSKFEVCAHKWADLSEPDYGIALLNDCKYGHATHGSTQRLTLLRSPKAPDDTADMGEHHFKYAVWPHFEGWQAGGVVSAGLCFNSPPVLVGATAIAPGPAGWLQSVAGCPIMQVVQVSSPGLVTPTGPLVIDTLKLAEPSLTPQTMGQRDQAALTPSKQLVVRLYEPHGCRGKAALLVGAGLQVASASLCNLLEDVLHDLPIARSGHNQGTTRKSNAGTSEQASGDCTTTQVLIDFKPFQVLTVMLTIN